MANQNFTGAFVFRNEGDGCLTGKYINNDQQEPYTECSKIKSETEQNGLQGIYTTTWIEEQNTTVSGTVEIVLRTQSSYKLKWKSQNGKHAFDGIGMMHGDLLVGAYWK